MNKKGTHAITIALSIVLLGATIMVSYGILQIEAAKSGTDISWCYSNENHDVACFLNHGDCVKFQQRDLGAISSCFKKKV